MNQIKDIQIEGKFGTNFIKLSINYQSLGQFEHNLIRCAFVTSNVNKLINFLHLP